jgi:outer membrane protein OmpA-like peptidoglycan-associated protein
MGDQGRTIVLEDGRQGLFHAVYFEPDSAVLIEVFRPTLELVGRQLAANPALRLLIRTYTAPFGTADGRYMVSVQRARFCRDYFTQNYNIASSRISLEAWGSEKTPEIVTADWQSYRCAELILINE